MKLLLVFLVVFCGQLFAASDVEMLPRVMGELKKDLDASKTWGDFLTKSNAFSNVDIMILNQNIGLDTKLPNYKISENLRTMTVGDNTLEVVNLSTGDYKINGKLIRIQAGESIYETMYKVKNKRSISFISLISSVAEAQTEKKDACETNSRLVNQVMVKDGLEKEIKNAGTNLVVATGAALHYHSTVGMDSKAQAKVRCEDIQTSLRTLQTENKIKLTDVNCDGSIRLTDRQLTFVVPATKAVAANRTNEFGVSVPNAMDTDNTNQRLQDANKGTLPGLKRMKLFVNWNVREVADSDLRKSYTYGDDGQILKTLSYEKEKGSSYTTLKCSPGADADFEKQYHLNRAIPVLRLFAQKGICYSDCYKQVKAMADENKAEYKKLIDSGQVNDLGDVVELEESERCKIVNNNIERDPCYVRPENELPCALRASQKIRPCNKRNQRKAEPASATSTR